MKKIICILMITALIVSLAACSGNSGDSSSTTAASTPADNSSKSSSVEATAAQTKDGTVTETQTAAPKTDGVDVDLTAMSSTMVYSEVLNMQQKPDEYEGKVVKMKGPFNVTEIDNNRYFACIIADATACCSTGIEFVWAGDHTYPDDYPAKDTQITVTGTFNTYMEGKNKYLQLKDADVVF